MNMEKDSSDSDITSEWLLLSWEDKPEGNKEEGFAVTSSTAFTSMYTKAFDSCSPKQNHPQTVADENKTEGSVEDGHGYLEEEISKISPDVNNIHVLEDGSSRDSSDIDVLGAEEDELGEKMASVNSHLSVFDLLTSSESSKFSLPKVEKSKKEHNEDLSDTSSVSKIPEGPSYNVDLRPSHRCYVNTPKIRLNFTLSMVAVFAMTTVIGLGVGNYLGWSHQWVHSSQVTLDPTDELKQMQNELLQCLREENTELSALGIERTFSQECSHDTHYWKQSFQVFFSDKNDEENFLKKTQKIRCNNVEVPLSFAEFYKEFHKLKLNFLLKLMENVKLLKNYKEVKQQEEQSQQLVDMLKAENNELRNKLEQENKDKFMDSKVSAVNNENRELKTKFQEDRKKDKIFEQVLINLYKENIKLKTVLLKKRATDLRKENIKLKDTLVRERSNFVNNSNYDTNVANKSYNGTDLSLANIEHVSDKEKYESNDSMKHVIDVEDRYDYGKILNELEEKVEFLKEETMEIKLKLDQQVSDKQVLINMEKVVENLKRENIMFLSDTLTKEKNDSQGHGFSTLKQQLQAMMAENDLLKLKEIELESKKSPVKHSNEEYTKQEKLVFDLPKKYKELKDQMIRIWNKIKVYKSERLNHKLLKQDNENTESFVALENPDKNLLVQLLATKPDKAQQLINMYDDMKKGKSDHYINGSVSFLEIIPQYNWTDMFQDILQDSNKVFFHLVKLMFSHIMNKSANLFDDSSSEKMLINFLKNINKLEEFPKIIQSAEFKSYTHQNPKLATKISKVFGKAFHKIHDACIQFLKEQTSVGENLKKLVDNILKTFDVLNRKWTHLNKRWEKIKENMHDKNIKKVRGNDVKIDKFQCSSSSSTENVNIKIKKNEVFDKEETFLNYPSSDWFFIRANEREQQHVIYPSQLFDDWHVRRARGRQHQRNLGIFNQIEENWFLKRNKGRRSSATNLYHYQVADS
ncbi:uncharacterized protein LOC106461577 isoform X2 [Limulus polyphemus]|uniref:Uncharacterized protein LOC106461577 isoform X2 n=1 Tax=Limulus polyphemus TaxID=6850 RepID=A0ABM1SKY2_LIMPO|nr:uncharacterized protein LOC106461577 isoform X2 [Limulus polyphemus]